MSKLRKEPKRTTRLQARQAAWQAKRALLGETSKAAGMRTRKPGSVSK